MSFEVWLAFVVTSAALLAIPGPTVLPVVSYALGAGRRSGLATGPRRPETLRLVHRIGGSCLIALGLLTAITRRAE